MAHRKLGGAAQCCAHWLTSTQLVTISRATDSGSSQKACMPRRLSDCGSCHSRTPQLHTTASRMAVVAVTAVAIRQSAEQLSSGSQMNRQLTAMHSTWKAPKRSAHDIQPAERVHSRQSSCAVMTHLGPCC